MLPYGALDTQSPCISTLERIVRPLKRLLQKLSDIFKNLLYDGMNHLTGATFTSSFICCERLSRKWIDALSHVLDYCSQ